MTPNDEGKWNDELFREELAAFYEENFDRLVDCVYRATGKEDDAENAVQAVFQQLIEKPALHKAFRKNPKGYIFRGAINGIRMMIRGRKRSKIEDEDVRTFEVAEPQLDPIREGNILTVRAALAKMQPEKAELLNLFYVDELSYKEIGTLLGTPWAAVMMQLYRARRAFTKLYRIEERKDGTQKTRHERLDEEGFAEASEG